MNNIITYSKLVLGFPNRHHVGSVHQGLCVFSLVHGESWLTMRRCGSAWRFFLWAPNGICFAAPKTSLLQRGGIWINRHNPDRPNLFTLHLSFWYNMPFYNMHYEIHKWHLLSKYAHRYWDFCSVCTNDLNVEPILKLSWDMPGQASGNERDNTYIVHVSQSSDPPAKAAWMLWLWVSNMVSGIIQFQCPNHIWTSVFVAIPCFQNHLHQSGSATHSVCVYVCVRVWGTYLWTDWKTTSTDVAKSLLFGLLKWELYFHRQRLGPLGAPRKWSKTFWGPRAPPDPQPPKISGSWSLQAVFVLGQSDTRCAHSILEDAASEAWGISDFH